MTSKPVKVMGDEFGNVINPSENSPEYGYIRLEQNVNLITEEGWFRPTKRTALIKGLITDLKEADFYANQVLPGKIIVKESLVPFNKEKLAGDTGIICRVDDHPIYRDSFYTTNVDAQDVLITHDDSCKEEIRQVAAANRALGKLSLKVKVPQEQPVGEAQL